jgi:hypothetical protein
VRRGAALVAALAVSGCAGGGSDLPDPRTAGDCVAFTKQAYADAGEASRAVFAPGTPPTVAVEAYWFGPTLGPRRAIVATEQEVSLPEAAGAVLPVYAVFYQLPADGCQSGLLPGYETAPEYWGAGHEIQVLSEPLDTSAAHRWIRDRGGLAGKPKIALEGGEEAIVLAGAADTGIVIGETLVTVTGAGTSRVRQFLATLRPVEGSS